MVEVSKKTGGGGDHKETTKDPLDAKAHQVSKKKQAMVRLEAGSDREEKKPGVRHLKGGNDTPDVMREGEGHRWGHKFEPISKRKKTATETIF